MATVWSTVKSVANTTIAILLVVLSSHACAQDTEDSASRAEDSLYRESLNQKTGRVNLHFQSTYIYQYKPSFAALYSGKNSLGDEMEKQNSLTATLYLGIRLWKGAEIYINPEVAGGSGLSGAFGLAANTNGETFRVGDPAPTLYLGRAYFSQIFALHEKHSFVPETANETGGPKPDDYLKLTVGKVSLGDLFDNNSYANSPRTQFMNWCLMNNGAWDYAADLRGYTYAFTALLQMGPMAYKAALATLPVAANSEDLNTNLGQEYSVNAEIDRAFTLGRFKRKGNVRLLGYYNNGDMGNYAQAIKSPDSNGVPDVIATRKYGRTKTGVGLSADQQLGDNLGVFMRLGWSDGQNETWCFTEADQSASVGLNVNGAGWKRKDDNLSFAILVNGLSAGHKNYLMDGGTGFQLGDGTLNYGHETALELFYNCKPFAPNIWVTGDYQFIMNPGYNRDRGPVHVFSIRVHVEL